MSLLPLENINQLLMYKDISFMGLHCDLTLTTPESELEPSDVG